MVLHVYLVLSFTQSLLLLLHSKKIFAFKRKVIILNFFHVFFSLQHNSEFGKIYYYQINLNWKITLAEQRTESRTKRHFLLFFVVVTKRIQKFLFLTQCCSLFRMFCFPSVCLCPLCNDVKTEKALFDYCLL